MIVRDKPSILSIFFIVRRASGSMLVQIYPQLLLVMGLSALVVLGHRHAPQFVPVVSSAPFALIGIALSIFLGFRNNACYDRWWEARKQWGELVKACRDLARQTLLLEGRAGTRGVDVRAALVDHAIAFTYALLQHLRPGEDEQRILERLPKAIHGRFRPNRNRPDFILREMGAILATAYRDKLISDIEFSLFDRTVSQMASVHAACERIRTTPVPFAYTLLLHRTAYMFCFLLPFGFADLTGWLTLFAAGMVAYTFFGLDTLGDELEEPFGELPNDLPIAAMADTIAIGLREALGETDLPPLPIPVDFVLM
ncbi:bestrophin family protein [Azorhizobium sp. AG788]|uniref:bestrophin family protein n=1 Tax=Azorhizobium sp. AG788 TaxID=2183897 RepID=UPI003139EBD9